MKEFVGKMFSEIGEVKREIEGEKEVKRIPNHCGDYGVVKREFYDSMLRFIPEIIRKSYEEIEKNLFNLSKELEESDLVDLATKLYDDISYDESIFDLIGLDNFSDESLLRIKLLVLYFIHNKFVREVRGEKVK